SPSRRDRRALIESGFSRTPESLVESSFSRTSDAVVESGFRRTFESGRRVRLRPDLLPTYHTLVRAPATTSTIPATTATPPAIGAIGTWCSLLVSTFKGPASITRSRVV